MKFSKLKLNGVFSTGEIELPLDSGDLTLIKGLNGSGKSTIISKGLLWTLFGETAEGLKGDDVLNRHIERHSEGSLHFSIKDNEYIISRHRYPNKTELDIFSKEKISPWPTRSDTRETQKVINNLIGKNLKTMVQTDFFGQGKMSAYAKLTPKDQKEVLESILPFDILNEWADKAKEARGKVQDKIEETKEELLTLKGKEAGIASSYLQIMRNFNEWEQKKVSAALIMKINFKDLTEKAEQRNSLRDEYSKLYNDIIECNKLKELKQIKLSNSEKDLENYKKELDSKLCSRCGQPITPETDKVTAAELIVKQHKEELDTIEQNYNQLLFNCNEVKKKLEDLEGVEKELKRYEELKKIREEKNPFEGTVNNLKKTIEELQEACVKKDKAYNELLDQLDIVRFWEKTYGFTLKNLMFENACPYMEERANYHLSKLNNENIKIKFNTVKTLKSGEVKEDFNVQVFNKTGGGSYEALSGGEKQIVDFAINLTLSELASLQAKGDTNIMVLDEPFTYLDAKNCENLTNYLLEISKNKDKSLFLISNDDNLSSLINNVIEVEKTGGITHAKT